MASIVVGESRRRFDSDVVDQKEVRDSGRIFPSYVCVDYWLNL